MRMCFRVYVKLKKGGGMYVGGGPSGYIRPYKKLAAEDAPL